MIRTAKSTTMTLKHPKATAVWLIENTILTFKQIAHFTNMSEVEIESTANEEINRGLVGRDPVANNELTQEELDRCQQDPSATLIAKKNDLPAVKQRSKGPRYTPISKRADKPNAILYIVKNNPEISDAQICKLVGTTKPTIQSIKERTHANMSNLRARHPADAGLCTYQEYEKAVEKGLRAQGKDPAQVKAEREQAAAGTLDIEPQADENTSGFDFSNFLNTDSSEASN